MKTLTVIATMCAVMGAQLAFAQATAEIHGTVQDSSGAAVPGATVKATQTDTGIPRTVTTEADGSYIFPNLAVGPYTIEVTKEGFSRYSQAGIVLQVNSNPTVAVTLQVGGAAQEVTVEANVTQVDTRSAGVGNVIENQRVIDLPLNGRLPTHSAEAAAIADVVITLRDGHIEQVTQRPGR